MNIEPSPYASMPGISIPVYSYEASTSPLHVEEFVDYPKPNRMRWTFPASYTGHRSVCFLPGATDDMNLIAWVGGETFTPGDPFGYSYAQGGEEVGDQLYIRAIELDTSHPSMMRKKLFTSETEQFVEKQPTGDECLRIRIVRSTIDGNPVSNYGVSSRTVLDKVFWRSAHDFISEADILAPGNLDLDYEYLYSDLMVAVSPGPAVEDVGYDIFAGDGLDEANKIATFHRLYDSQSVFNASKPVPLYPDDDIALTTNKLVLKWAIPGNLRGYTGFRLTLWGYTGSTMISAWDTGYVKMPPRIKDGDNVFRYEFAAPFLVGEDMSPSEVSRIEPYYNNTTYKWRMTLVNSRFRENWSPFASFSTAVPES